MKLAPALFLSLLHLPSDSISTLCSSCRFLFGEPQKGPRPLQHPLHNGTSSQLFLSHWRYGNQTSCSSSNLICKPVSTGSPLKSLLSQQLVFLSVRVMCVNASEAELKLHLVNGSCIALMGKDGP